MGAGLPNSLRGWSRRRWITIGVSAATVLIIIIGVAVGVTEIKKNAYPDYSRLNYTLADTYSGTDFFDNFDYFSGDGGSFSFIKTPPWEKDVGADIVIDIGKIDPTHGFVDYVDQETAQSLNLTYTDTSVAVLRVDSSNSSTITTGRKSVRVTSKTQYDKGLFIFDVKHSPFGCATWPALWLADADNWPTNGEIDIMETVNRADTGNQMTLHTEAGCTMQGHRREMTGEALHANCDAALNSNSGCGVRGENSSYGQALNAGGGGITAVEWRSAGIRVWQFPRDDIPGDIRNNTPDPSTWGSASADFPNTGCNIDKHFRNQSIIINISLCGDWAGGSAYTESGCKSARILSTAVESMY